SSRDRVRVDAALAELSRAAAARGCAGTSGLGNNLVAPAPPHSLLGRDR
ncbi:methylmalonyl-CoA mutase, partial [Pseudomonas aeruginosa]|nr:methylmalonyl-CoA mutase [Pseudomonas aeruginosa]